MTAVVAIQPPKLFGFCNFEQYISEQQALLEFATWVHSKGELVAHIGNVIYDKAKAS